MLQREQLRFLARNRASYSASSFATIITATAFGFCIAQYLNSSTDRGWLLGSIIVALVHTVALKRHDHVRTGLITDKRVPWGAYLAETAKTVFTTAMSTVITVGWSATTATWATGVGIFGVVVVIVTCYSGAIIVGELQFTSIKYALGPASKRTAP